MYQYLLLLLFIILMIKLNTGCLIHKEGYLSYSELPIEPNKKNCPQIHVYNYNRLANRDKRKDFFGEENLWESYPDQEDLKDKPSTIKSAYQMIQPFGYTKNELFDMTRLIETDIPLPTDPDFFKHI